MNTALIIGGGTGGLFTAAILAKEGYRVTVVEKNATLGGGLQTFTRFGERFDTGMHVIGGMQPGGNLWRLCRYLGILDDIHLRDVDDACTDDLYFAEDRQHYRIAKGREGFVRSLAAYFPEERQRLKNYVDAVFRLVDEIDFFHLRPASSVMQFHNADFLMAADQFVAKYIADRRLRAVVSYMNPLYGGRGGQTPAFIHAIVSVLYITGASRFVGGSSRFAERLAQIVTDSGGEIIRGDGVERIEVTDRRVDCVRTRSGRTLTADHYISAIHPCTMLRLMDEHAFPRSYRERLDSIPNSYSAFSLYMKMKPHSFPYVNHSEYYMSRYDDIWRFGRTDRPWPLGFLCMTPPDDGQGEYSTKVLVTAPMPFESVARWADTTPGRRGQDYAAWKEERTQELLRCMDELHPGFTSQIEAINSSSPLTIRDFYGSKEGCLCGFSKDVEHIALSQVPIATKVRNLLLTGQNNNLHGFCGVGLTAIQTAEALLGKNYVLNRIALCDTL